MINNKEKEFNKKSKYFYVFNEEEANLLGYMLNRQYYVFTDNRDGNKVFSFEKDDIIVRTYRILKVILERTQK